MTRRFGMACRLRPERREEYLELHAAVWPGVESMITACGIRNFTIFVRGDVLFGYSTRSGTSADAGARSVAMGHVGRAASLPRQ